MSDDRSFDDHEFALVMPFEVCKSRGGPYDDEAFAAGWHLAQIREALSHPGTSWRGVVRVASLPQLELIAMERGLNATVVDPSGEWASVTVAE